MPLDTEYAKAIAAFKVRYLLRAVDEAGGNMCRASARTGVHRNTILRILGAAGFHAKALRKRAKIRRAMNQGATGAR